MYIFASRLRKKLKTIIKRMLSICKIHPIPDRVSLYSPGCLVTHYIDQAGLEFTKIPVPLLGLKTCSPCPIQNDILIHQG